jgi:DNA-binding NarL/FixJ family response regulator
MKKIKLLLADDHRIVLKAIAIALEHIDDFEIVGEAHTGAQVLPLVGQTDPDVLLLDLRMPAMDGLRVLELMRERFPKVKVIVLSGVVESDVMQAALARGACAFVAKHIDPRDLASAIRQAVEGTVVQPLGLPEPEQDGKLREAGLSERELVILAALGRGLSNKELGQELWVAEQTIKFHLTNIYRKLGVKNRTEAVRYAYRHGLVDNPVYDSKA